jgi:hypothetical protein
MKEPYTYNEFTMEVTFRGINGFMCKDFRNKFNIKEKGNVEISLEDKSGFIKIEEDKINAISSIKYFTVGDRDTIVTDSMLNLLRVAGGGVFPFWVKFY